MAFGGNMNVADGLIGTGVGVAISGLASWLKRPQLHDVWIADGTRCRVGIHDLAPLSRIGGGNGTADSPKR